MSDYPKDYRDNVFEIVTRLRDDDGRPIFSVEQLCDWIESQGDSIVRYCWCVHNKCKYTQKDVDKANRKDPLQTRVVLGQPIPEHLHCAVEVKNKRYFKAIAKSIGLTSGCIKKCTSEYNPDGADDEIKRYKFLAIATYMSHKSKSQQRLGKYRYPASEIRTSGWDYEAETDKFLLGFANKSKSCSGSGSVRVSTLFSEGLPETIDGVLPARSERVFARMVTDAIHAGEISPREVQRRYGFSFYDAHQKSFDNARNKYLRSDAYVMPQRVNIYIGPSQELIDSGLEPGGIGKTSLARKIARALYPELDMVDTYVEVTDPAVAFEDYEEQPLLLWDESRAGGMIGILGRGKTFTILETNPGKNAVNVKYSHRLLVNTGNIVNGIAPAIQYLDGLAGQYIDKNGNVNVAEARSQVYRRFPFVLEMTSTYIVVWVNRFTFDLDRDPNAALDFREYARINVDFGNLMRTYDGAALAAQLSELLETTTVAVNDFLRRVSDKIENIDDILIEDKPVVELFTPGTGRVMNSENPCGYLPDRGNAVDESQRLLDAQREEDRKRYQAAYEQAKVSAGYINALELYESEKALFDSKVARANALQKYADSKLVMTDSMRDELWSLKRELGVRRFGTYSNEPKKPDVRDFMQKDCRELSLSDLLKD